MTKTSILHQPNRPQSDQIDNFAPEMADLFIRLALF